MIVYHAQAPHDTKALIHTLFSKARANAISIRPIRTPEGEVIVQVTTESRHRVDQLGKDIAAAAHVRGATIVRILVVGGDDDDATHYVALVSKVIDGKETALGDDLGAWVSHTASSDGGAPAAGAQEELAHALAAIKVLEAKKAQSDAHIKALQRELGEAHLQHEASIHNLVETLDATLGMVDDMRDALTRWFLHAGSVTVERMRLQVARASAERLALETKTAEEQMQLDQRKIEAYQRKRAEGLAMADCIRRIKDAAPQNNGRPHDPRVAVYCSDEAVNSMLELMAPYDAPMFLTVSHEATRMGYVLPNKALIWVGMALARAVRARGEGSMIGHWQAASEGAYRDVKTYPVTYRQEMRAFIEDAARKYQLVCRVAVPPV